MVPHMGPTSEALRELFKVLGQGPHLGRKRRLGDAKQKQAAGIMNDSKVNVDDC